MKMTCDFCREYLSDTDETCPHCGAKNPHYKRQSNDTPHTIEELKQWYKDHHLPPQSITRFFIGVNTTEPKAFGIYQDGDRFIVYKNKADGSRAVRYDGGDEAYAVNEIYLKLKEQIAEQKANSKKGKNPKRTNKKVSSTDVLRYSVFGVIGLSILIAFGSLMIGPSYGYYRYQDEQYYYLDDDWYIYDTDTSEWNYTEVDKELEKNSDDYFQSHSYQSEYGISDFSETSYYETWEEGQESDDDWDDDWDSDWDSGDSWDSDSGDWDSDW